MKKTLAAACAMVMALAVGTMFSAVPASAASDVQSYADEVVALVNAERAAYGLDALEAVPVLNAAAEKRSEEIVTYFSHTRPDGRSCSTVLADYNIEWRASGENIAYGYASPEAVVDGWMHSEGHRANILSTSFDYIGVGVVSERGTLYWTQVFTGGVTLADAYLPGAETQPVRPEVQPETQPVRPEVQPETQPVRPEVQPETQPVRPETQPTDKPCADGSCDVICPDGSCITICPDGDCTTVCPDDDCAAVCPDSSCGPTDGVFCIGGYCFQGSDCQNVQQILGSLVRNGNCGTGGGTGALQGLLQSICR